MPPAQGGSLPAHVKKHTKPVKGSVTRTRVGETEQIETEPEGGLKMGKLDGKKIAFVAADGVEQVELVQPWDAVKDAGGEPELLSLEDGQIQGFNHLDHGDKFDVDKKVADADPSDYDALVLPGGVANPDFLRADEDVRKFVRSFFEAGKPVGAICHGPWTLIDAGVAKGATLTSWPTLRTDLENAGANWVDEEVHVDGGLVTSRNPDDLPAFCAKIVEEFCEGRHDHLKELAGAAS
jgi:deglycase